MCYITYHTEDISYALTKYAFENTWFESLYVREEKLSMRNI